MNFPTWMHSSANLPRYIHFPNYDREIRLHSHSPARIKQASTKREKFPSPVNPDKNQPKMLRERGTISTPVYRIGSPIRERKARLDYKLHECNKNISKYIVQSSFTTDESEHLYPSPPSLLSRMESKMLIRINSPRPIINIHYRGNGQHRYRSQISTSD